MIYVTGDTHGMHDIGKFDVFKKTRGEKLTKNDFIIVLGDFGVFWEPSLQGLAHPNELRLIKYYSDLPWTTLFLDGNHENFVRINEFPIIDYNGGKVNKINDSIYHLRRGEVYNINGKIIFTMGGALSIDKGRRIAYKSWWPEEEITSDELKHGLATLKRFNNNVDYVLTHTVYESAIDEIREISGLNLSYKRDSSTVALQAIKEVIEYKKWYCGHFHENMYIPDINGKLRLVYERIIPLGE
ncbi:MAG: metallophosphoesterase [Candidatus Paceibacterota bacterium]|jgi:hypothetical protein